MAHYNCDDDDDWLIVNISVTLTAPILAYAHNTVSALLRS